MYPKWPSVFHVIKETLHSMNGQQRNLRLECFDMHLKGQNKSLFFFFFYTLKYISKVSHFFLLTFFSSSLYLIFLCFQGTFVRSPYLPRCLLLFHMYIPWDHCGNIYPFDPMFFPTLILSPYFIFQLISIAIIKPGNAICSHVGPLWY